MEAKILLKYTFDFILCLFLLIVLGPLILLIIIAIKLNSKGPAFFLQKRLGKDGSEFNIVKFRTMVNNAEKIGTGLSIKSENDNRITNVGKFLRKTSLDEIPQLINVIKGDMSLVGPRPPVTYHPYDGYAKYPLWAKKRFVMRPGITGLSQITVRNSVSWDERIKIDIIYIENYSLTNDIIILFRTALKIFRPSNIYQ